MTDITIAIAAFIISVPLWIIGLRNRTALRAQDRQRLPQAPARPRRTTILPGDRKPIDYILINGEVTRPYRVGKSSFSRN